MLARNFIVHNIYGLLKCITIFFSERCSPMSFMGPKRYRPPACTVSELPDVLDAVVISHTHYDHMDGQSIKDLHKR